MPKVKLTKPWEDHKVGEIVEISNQELLYPHLYNLDGKFEEVKPEAPANVKPADAKADATPRG